jgi:amino acid adenylation domain-containing protein
VTASLHGLFGAAAARHPERAAVVLPGRGEITYGELDRLSSRLRDRLHAIGVRPGDRVGIYVGKSIDSVAAICGILKSGAAYVPVDPTAPPARNAYIVDNCRVAALIVEARFRAGLEAELRTLGRAPPLLVLDAAGTGDGLARALDAVEREAPATVVATAEAQPDALAYILYTSGSTGKPKGVMLSHENAVSFVDWCSEVFAPGPDDRFSSHAPFHFDLSILDLHVALKHGASIVLIPEERGKDPQHLAQLIDDHRISIWYSAPSILSLLAQFGDLRNHDCSSLRLVLFAGEVFPVKHLRTLTTLLPKPRYFNLYGPTETNVCTYYEVVPPVPDERTVPYPIGAVCSHLRGKVIGPEGETVGAGDEGELCITGRGVMQGYWELPEQTARGFIVDADDTRWYRTGDVVVEEAGGIYTYRGRRDRMVKRRGYRVELGEIEGGLYQHPRVKEVAVVATPDEEAGVRVTAFLSVREGAPPSLVEMKRFAAERLPLYMVPDRFTWLEALPKTSTDKVDYQALKAMVQDKP